MNENYLAHYGIKRRSGRYPYGSGERPYQGISKAKSMAKAKIKQVDMTKRPKKTGLFGEAVSYYADEYNKDRTMKKGSLVYRISTEEREKEEGGTYVYYKESDYKNYTNPYNAAALPTGSFDLVPDKQLKYRLKTDVKIPSMQKMADAYLDVFMNAHLDENLSKAIERNPALKIDLGTFSTIPMKEAQEKLYKSMINNPDSAFYEWIGKDVLRGQSKDLGEMGQKWISKLQEDGYGAIPDFNDNRYYDDPLFVFDRSKTMEYKGTNKPFEERYKKKIN